jgi:hypothetical protein
VRLGPGWMRSRPVCLGLSGPRGTRTNVRPKGKIPVGLNPRRDDRPYRPRKAENQPGLHLSPALRARGIRLCGVTGSRNAQGCDHDLENGRAERGSVPAAGLAAPAAGEPEADLRMWSGFRTWPGRRGLLFAELQAAPLPRNEGGRNRCPKAAQACAVAASDAARASEHRNDDRGRPPASAANRERQGGDRRGRFDRLAPPGRRGRDDRPDRVSRLARQGSPAGVARDDDGGNIRPDIAGGQHVGLAGRAGDVRSVASPRN